ncbi:VanZ family protein [Rhodovulum sp. YNF3179]|uniref:VanZ family protein n=1 Tax=Rhodovulum sp. YNF3179 TaxID=3425127 RepID=UPI003D33DF1B
MFGLPGLPGFQISLRQPEKDHSRRYSKVPSVSHSARYFRLGPFLTVGLFLILAVLGGVMAILGPPLAGNHLGLGDKTVHMLVFGLAAFLAALFRPQSIWVIAPLGILYGGGIELIQPAFGRSADWIDFGANGLGIALGMTVAFGVQMVRARLVFPRPSPESPHPPYAGRRIKRGQPARFAGGAHRFKQGKLRHPVRHG